jgi:hypothetical protein
MAFAPDDVVPVGRLAYDRNVGVFEYDPGFIASGLVLSPFFAEPSRELGGWGATEQKIHLSLRWPLSSG